MQTRRGVVVAVCLAVAVGAACGADDPLDEDATIEERYRRHCAACHGGDGSGASGPAIGGGLLASAPQAEVVAVIADGEGTMPGFSDRLTDVQIEEMATYVRTELGVEASDGSGAGDAP